ncbi:hypothetical protein D4764_06G0007430 [Takifugu flavidus]|uniref:Alkylated DNA repair protein AlkB homologue 8 N-terminal domain-containing protein n=1 Tax=Takifugu flavidus TaxID=433684 RepID=A0A5C6MW29_9TELE|nr:hypothetical protein D4764_06G0007430 [Takifugu flavidus]
MRDQVMAQRPPSFVVGEKPQIPKELRRKRRGSKAGVKQRIKSRRFIPCVPAVITGNVRSLANKMDELEALTRTQQEYREASIMRFTETWLHGLIPDSNVTITGFSSVNRWCNPEHIHVKERMCSPDVELIAIGLRLYYLPREFSNVIAITVYIPLTGKANTACDVIHSVTADLQTKHPGAFILITDGAMDCLRDALETTNWSALCEPHGEDLDQGNGLGGRIRPGGRGFPTPDLDGLTDCVSDYIKFCTENSVPTKKVRCYPNNKPWVTSDLKALLNKKRAFTAGDQAELRRVQKELKHSLKESKDTYRKKLEERLERNQTRDVWSGLRTITGFQKKGICSADGNVDQANELNQFFNRFDSSSPSPSCPNIPLDNNGSPSHLPEPLTPLPTSSPSPLLTPYIDTNMSPIPPTGLSFTSSQGLPKELCSPPFLFTTYTADFQYHSETCHLQKYSDDTVIVGYVENGQEDEYRDLVESFVRWSMENLLQLNVTKTKEMVVDFSKSKSPPSPVCISGKEVEIVPFYRFLGVQLDNKLEWSTNTDAVYKKAMSRLYFLRRLRSFSVCSRMLHRFYQSVMASTIFFAVVCWGAGIKAKDANRLNKRIKKAGSVVGCKLANLDEVVRDRMVLKLRTIMDSPSHPLHNTVDKLRSSFSNRLLQPCCSKERYRKSFLPSAIRLLYNSSKPTQQQ